MKPKNGHNLRNVVAGIVTEAGFSVGLLLSLCLLAYLVATLAR
ncbi:MAG: hypothetical protein WD024_00735 [Bacillota bacterium]